MAWLRSVERFAGKNALLALFVLCVLPTGIVSALLTPPGQTPDEGMHLARAAGLLHGAVLGTRKQRPDPNTGRPQWEVGVKADKGDILSGFGHFTMMNGRLVVTSQDFLADRARPVDHSMLFDDLPNTVKYFPVAYLPASLALALGRLANAPPYACFLLARLFMLAAYLAVGAAAIWVAAYGEAFFFTILLLPLTLFLGASLNQDGLLTAMVCLACAALTRGRPGFRWLGLACLVIVFCSKPPYTIMMGVFLLPWFGPGFWRRVREVAVACVPVVLWVAVVSSLELAPFLLAPYHPGPLFTGDRSVTLDHSNDAANLHILLAEPSRFITLPWQTMREQFVVAVWTMVGAIGFYPQFLLPWNYCMAWCACLGIAWLGAFCSGGSQKVRPGRAAADFAVVFGLLIVTYWLLLISLYIDWTQVGADRIDGVMGRYSLPLLAFALFAIPRLRLRLPPLLPALPAVAMGLYDIGYLPMKLVWNYYLH